MFDHITSHPDFNEALRKKLADPEWADCVVRELRRFLQIPRLWKVVVTVYPRDYYKQARAEIVPFIDEKVSDGERVGENSFEFVRRTDERWDPKFRDPPTKRFRITIDGRFVSYSDHNGVYYEVAIFSGEEAAETERAKKEKWLRDNKM